MEYVIIGALSSFLLAAANAINIIIKSLPIYYWITHVLLFIVTGTCILLFRKKALYAVILVTIGCAINILGDKNNFSGIIYILFAISMTKKKEYILLIICFGIISIISKCIIFPDEAPTIINLIIGSIITSAIYFNLTKNELRLPGQKRYTDDDIINSLISGMTAKEIAYDLNITSNAVNKHMQRIRKNHGCRNNEQLISELYKSGFFRKNEA